MRAVQGATLCVHLQSFSHSARNSPSNETVPPSGSWTFDAAMSFDDDDELLEDFALILLQWGMPSWRNIGTETSLLSNVQRVQNSFNAYSTMKSDGHRVNEE